MQSAASHLCIFIVPYDSNQGFNTLGLSKYLTFSIMFPYPFQVFPYLFNIQIANLLWHFPDPLQFVFLLMVLIFIYAGFVFFLREGGRSLIIIWYKDNHLEYKHAHCPGVFQFIIKSVKRKNSNPHFLYIGCIYAEVHNPKMDGSGWVKRKLSSYVVAVKTHKLFCQSNVLPCYIGNISYLVTTYMCYSLNYFTYRQDDRLMIERCRLSWLVFGFPQIIYTFNASICWTICLLTICPCICRYTCQS